MPIQKAFAALVALPGFRRREAQERLAQGIYDGLCEGRAVCAEAPTGTGKSLAYLIGALAAAQTLEAREKRPFPVVISTNTVGLQSQILDKDAPILAEAGLLDVKKVQAALGRGRYLCLAAAQRHAGRPVRAESRQSDLFGMTDVAQNLGRVSEAERLFLTWQKGGWSGVVDQWPGGARPHSWDDVKMSQESCIGSRCWAYQSACPFYQDRRALAEASVVVANHNLVLADLDARASGRESIFPYEDYLLILDEAHNFPVKALESATNRADLSGAREWLRQIPSVAEEISHEPASFDCIDSEFWYQSLRGTRLARRIATLQRAIERLHLGTEETPEFLRYPEAEGVPTEILARGGEVLEAGWPTLAVLRQVREGLERMVGLGYAGAQNWLGRLSAFEGRMESLLSSLQQFIRSDRPARWLELSWGPKGRVQGMTLASAPVSSGEVLEQLLWDQLSRVAFVSATLKIDGSFDHFSQQAGLPSNTRYLQVPHIFPYERSILEVPRLPVSPRANPERYHQALADWINANVDPDAANLVLFTSYQAMQAVASRLRPALALGLNLQERGLAGKAVAAHRNLVSKGIGALLMGTGTFSEGLDLAGEYCTHLVITRLPFETPNNPIALAQRDRDVEGYFEKHVVPDTTTRLIQAAGRLVRRETDCGRISILDRRAIDTPFGRRMLDSLPPFRRIGLAATAPQRTEMPEQTVPIESPRMTHPSAAPADLPAPMRSH